MNWKVIYIKLSTEMLFEQMDGGMLVSEPVLYVVPSPMLRTLRAIFRQELVKLARWRDEAVVDDDWRRMKPIWKRGQGE